MKSKSILVLAVVFLVLSSASNSFATTRSFQGLGDLPGGGFESSALGISADGSVVVGYGTSNHGVEAFCWTKGEGMMGLGDLPGGQFYSYAVDVSVGGSVIVGSSESVSGIEVFLWKRKGGMVGLGNLPGGDFYARAQAVSADGSIVVGMSNTDLANEAFIWTQASGMQPLGDLPGGNLQGWAYGISSDGSVIVGDSSSDLGIEAFRWTEDGGMVGLGDLPGSYFNSHSLGVSADGSVVVGWGKSSMKGEAFRWTQNTGMVAIGPSSSRAYDTSGDGSVVVGNTVGSSYSVYNAFLWDQSNGLRYLEDILINEYGLDLTGWQLYSARAISDDGLVITGYGKNPDGNREAWIVTFREPSTPPVADADGPYTIYVGDMLTLDASGSTDPDDDIASYMWDLDDVENFETDASGQAIFDVNYTYLQSLGLLINHTYTIHLKVTDSEQQSDIADSTLTIIPKPVVKVAVDIKPGSCPNPVNVKSSGVLPIAILGTEDYDVTTIDPTSIRFAGVEPIRSSYEDVAGPLVDANECECTTQGPDGFLDLTLKFKTQRIVEAIGDVNDGDELQLELIGVLFDETPIEGADCILIRGRHKPINPADINKDGMVDGVDFAIFAQNWLQSNIVQD